MKTTSNHGDLYLKKLGVAIVGTGFLANIYARCYLEMPNVELIATSSQQEAHAKMFAQQYGIKSWYINYEKMFKRTDIDAVNVCVPNYLHAPVTILAAENRKHVLCTKPLAINMKQAEEMVSVSRKVGVHLMYGENWLFTPTTERLIRIINQRAFGRLLAIEAREQHSGSHSPYSIKKKFSGGGVLIHMAVHPIGFIMHIMNQPIKRVYAELGNLYHNIDVEDYAVLLMRFKNGSSGIASSNYITQGGMQDRIELYGSEGMAFINLTQSNPIQIFSKKGYEYVGEKVSMSRGWTSPVIDEQIHYGFANMLSHFIDCILRDEQPKSDGIFGKSVLKTVFAGYESYDKQKSINLEQ